MDFCYGCRSLVKDLGINEVRRLFLDDELCITPEIDSLFISKDSTLSLVCAY
jgi:hypothetical protein